MKIMNNLSKLLLSIILVLVCLILFNYNNGSKEFVKKNVFENKINLGLLNKYYKKFIGDFDNDEENVNSDIISGNVVLNGDYYDISNDDGIVSNISSGIIVYIGDKDDCYNCMIVQGNDGVDVWYNNITDLNYSLYDYVSKGSILGYSDQLSVKFIKSGEKISYEEYIG